MPGFDGTGPVGFGVGTGRGFGPCGLGMGWRKRFGFGRGLGRYFNWNWPQSNDDKLKSIREYKQALKEELEDVEKEEQNLTGQK